MRNRREDRKPSHLRHLRNLRINPRVRAERVSPLAGTEDIRLLEVNLDELRKMILYKVDRATNCRDLEPRGQWNGGVEVTLLRHQPPFPQVH
jgi:hypothetical protein